MFRPPPTRVPTAPARSRRIHTQLRSAARSAAPPPTRCPPPRGMPAADWIAPRQARHCCELAFAAPLASGTGQECSNASPRSRQNSIRLKPLDSNSATNCSTSARLRRRPTTHTCCSFMLLLHHQIHRRNRWVGLTLTVYLTVVYDLERRVLLWVGDDR